MSRPKVSVIVPCYNAEKYISQTIECLANQTLKDIEIIVIDDGSTDRSGELLDLYAGMYDNMTVVHQPCISQANAMNRGARLARGEYIAECDADDFVSPQMYEKLYAASDGKADVVRCGYFGVWDTGHIQPNPLNIPEKYLKVDPHALKGKEQAVVFGKVVLIPAGIYRREFILDNQLFWREDGQNYEDTCLSYKIRAMAHDYRFLNENLYYYRRGNPTSGSATIKDENAIREQYEEIERFSKEHDLPHMDYMDARRYYDYIWSLKRTPDERRVDFIMNCMNDFREHPAPREYFNTDEDFRNYCIIKYGAWVETGVRE